ncbi:MAG: response regulator, partial [Mariprofundaceae bacterium]|nr:response regulator [Mariprofundaceae bacterium]
VVMPNLGGIAAAKSIRNNPRNVPILFMTAYDPNESTDAVAWMTNSDMITKPFDPIVLHKKINQLIA